MATDFGSYNWPGGGSASANASVGTNNSAIPTSSTLIGGTDGTNLRPIAVSAAGVISINDPDSSTTGTITAADAVVAAPAGDGTFRSGASTAGSLVAIACPGGDSAWNIQLTGTLSGTFYYEGSLDSTTGTDGNWINLNGRQTGIVNTVLGGSTTTAGYFRGNTSGMKYIRIRNVGGSGLTAAVKINISSGTGAIFLNASIPAGTNTIGALTANQSVNNAQLNGVTLLAGNGVTGTGAQRVTIASDNTAFSVNATLQAGAATIGALTANQSVNNTQLNGVALLAGNGVTGTGSQRVTIASDNTAFAVNATLQTGSNTIGALTANQSVNAAQINGVAPLMGNGVTGTGSMRVTIASDTTSNTNAFLVDQNKSATATLSNVVSSATTVTILASNAARKNATIFNDSTAVLYLKFGATASTTSYTVQIPALGYYELPVTRTYTGIMDGIWASANGNARVTELT